MGREQCMGMKAWLSCWFGKNHGQEEPGAEMVLYPGNSAGQFGKGLSPIWISRAPGITKGMGPERLIHPWQPAYILMNGLYHVKAGMLK